MKILKLLAKPLIWIKDFQENAVLYLTKKADKKIGASDRNRFKDWASFSRPSEYRLILILSGS